MSLSKKTLIGTDLTKQGNSLQKIVDFKGLSLWFYGKRGL